MATPEDLPDDVAALKRIITEMARDAATVQAEIAKLKFQLARCRRAELGRSFGEAGAREPLEARVAQEGLVLTEAQLGALEKAKGDKEFDSECPGYCGAQDTFCVGTLKGIGRVYQQSFTDTYAKVAFA